MRKTNGKPPSMPVLMTDDGRLASTDDEKVEVLATTFASIWDGTREGVPQEWKEQVDSFVSAHAADLCPVREDEVMDPAGPPDPLNSPVEEWEVIKELSGLSTRISVGPDEVHNLMLKCGGTFMTKSLTFLYGISFQRG